MSNMVVPQPTDSRSHYYQSSIEWNYETEEWVSKSKSQPQQKKESQNMNYKHVLIPLMIGLLGLGAFHGIKDWGEKIYWDEQQAHVDRMSNLRECIICAVEMHPDDLEQLVNKTVYLENSKYKSCDPALVLRTLNTMIKEGIIKKDGHSYSYTGLNPEQAAGVTSEGVTPEQAGLGSGGQGGSEATPE